MKRQPLVVFEHPQPIMVYTASDLLLEVVYSMVFIILHGTLLFDPTVLWHLCNIMHDVKECDTGYLIRLAFLVETFHLSTALPVVP